MGVEIERKFLVNSLEWSKVKTSGGFRIIQGYITKEIDHTVRIRVKGEQGFLTIKGRTKGATRPEFEYEIPVSEAREMLNAFCDRYVEKTRYEVLYAGKKWEIDDFHQPNKGLILAEIELKDENEEFEIPHWITKEVTSDPRYYNANML